MHARLIFFVCSVAVFLLLVASSVTGTDDQYYPRPRKVSSGAWISAHQIQPLGKRGRFVFRAAPTAHRYDSADDDSLFNDDAQEANAHLDKRNWRL